MAHFQIYFRFKIMGHVHTLHFNLSRTIHWQHMPAQFSKLIPSYLTDTRRIFCERKMYLTTLFNRAITPSSELWTSFNGSSAHSGPRPLEHFNNHFSQTLWLLGRTMNPSQGWYLNTGQYEHRISAYTHRTSIPWVGFEHKIPSFKRTKTVHVYRRGCDRRGWIEKIYLLFRSRVWGGLVQLIHRANNYFNSSSLTALKPCVDLELLRGLWTFRNS
jgi:hypothetical protein